MEKVKFEQSIQDGVHNKLAAMAGSWKGSCKVWFGPDTLAEVAVSAPWGDRTLAGSIDRLVIAPDRILVIDYKSNAVVPASQAQVPEGILRQLGAYAHMVAQIYPDRRVETAVLWTRGPVLMPVDPEIVRAALSRATIP